MEMATRELDVNSESGPSRRCLYPRVKNFILVANVFPVSKISDHPSINFLWSLNLLYNFKYILAVKFS